MAIRIVTADERLRVAGTRTTIFLVGEYAVGKTSLLYTLPAETTLALDFEGGFKSVSTWKGDSIHIRAWMDAVNLACYIGGPDPAVTDPNDFYSQAHYNMCVGLYGWPNGTEAPINLDKYKTIWFDSISDLTIAAKMRAREKNIMFDKKNGTQLFERNGDVMIDNRGMYGDIANDVMTLVRHMQHCEGKNIIWVGKLELVTDEFKRQTWEPQLEGQKIRRELPFVVDQVVTMGFFDWSENLGWQHNPNGKGAHRVFVCQRTNPWGLPAKERTLGNLEMIEEPHLGKLLEKINAPAKAEAEAALKFSVAR